MEDSRISACTYPLRGQGVAYALQVVGQSGFHQADLWGGLPHFSVDPAQYDMAELVSLSERLGVRIANLGTYPGEHFTAPSEAEREAELVRMRATIDAAVLLGARSIRVMPGRGKDPALIEQIAPALAESAAYAEQRGIYLGMENHGGSLAGNPEHALQLCRAVGSPYFGVLYEPCNLDAARVDYKRAFEALADHIVHVHLKDGRWTDQGYQSVHLGQGQVDIAWVVRALEDLGYQGDYALEYELEEEPVETNLPKWYEYFRGLTV